MSFEDSLSRIVSENRKAREANTKRLSRLIDATATGDDLTGVLDDIDGGSNNGETLGPNVTPEGMDGGDRGQTDTAGSGPTGEESAS